MKKLLLIIMMFAGASLAFGQRFVTSTYVEKTSVGPKTGIAIGAVNQYGMEYGGFYQEAGLAESLFMSETEVERLPKRYERVFYGLYVTQPIVSYPRASIKFNLRTGVANSENFVITPSLLTDYKLTSNISFGFGLGIRSLAPTIQTGISISL